MLCSFCEGTENSPLPHTYKLHGAAPLQMPIPVTGQADECLTCGEGLLDPCPECIGLGLKLKVMGLCSRCGRSIPFWQECGTCRGSGKVYNTSHTCALQPRKPHPAHLSHSPDSAHKHTRRGI